MTHNIYILVNYALTGGFAFLLCYYCSKNIAGSLLGSLVFTFSSNHLLQTMSHLGFSAIQWIPLFILSLFYLWEKRKLYASFYCALSFCFLFWSSYYFLYFSIFFVACFILTSIYYKQLFEWKKISLFSSLALGICIVVLSPQWVPIVKNMVLSKSSVDVSDSGYVRSSKDVAKYGARLSDYILPSEYHPFLGRLTKWVQHNLTKKGRHWSDRTLYLGIFSILMVVVLFLFRNRATVRDRFYMNVSIICALFYIWFSLRPWVSIGTWSFPTPSAILYPIFPMFRYYSRAGFFVSIFLAILVSYGWKYLSQNLKNKKVKNGFCVLAGIFILFEFTVVPPSRNIDLSHIPPIYKWLSVQEGDFAVVEYPFVRNVDERYYKYLFYIKFHEKKLVNGGRGGTLAGMLRKQALHINDPQTWSLLSHYNVKYALVHEDVDKYEKIPYLEKVQDYGSSAVFKINAKEMPLYTLLWNFGQALKRPDGLPWRWIGQTAKIWCLNTSKQDLKTKLTLTLFSPEENNLKVILNDKEVFEIQVMQGETGKTTIEIPNLNLNPGENLFEFVPKRMVSRPDQNSQKVSFCLARYQISLN